MDQPRCWLIIILLTLACFFFAASETSLSCCNRFKFQVKADDGSKTAKLVLRVCNRYDRALTTVLIGYNISSIIIATVSTLLFLDVFSSSGMNDSSISLIASISMTLLVYIFGDLMGKTLGKALPDTISFIFVWPIFILGILIYPIAIVFEGISKLLSKIFSGKKDDVFTEEDFENVVEKVSDEGLLEEEQSEIIQSALEFVDTNVKEVLTPREKMYAIDIKQINQESLKQVILNTNYSRIPVYEREFDNVIGVLNVKTYFKEITKNPNVSIRRILQKPYFVSQRIMIDDLFNGFKKHHSHIALVVNNDKRIIGMVTMEDVLEELVSDISEPNSQKGRK